MLQDLVSNYLPQLGTAGHTELRAQRNTSLSIGLLSGNLINNSSSEQSGVSARVFKNGVWGFSSAAEYDDESIRAVLRAAEQNALFMDSRVQKGAGPLLSLPSG